MKRIILIFLVILISFANVSFAEIDIGINECTIEININYDKAKTFKALIEKDDEYYIYNIVSEKSNFSLQMGNGSYRIRILESKDDRRFKTIYDRIIRVNVNEELIFLTSVQNINWTYDSFSTLIAKWLTKNAETDEEKLKLIYNFIVRYVSYDYSIIDSLPKGYIPNPQETLFKGRGICYDYSSLMASMLRSVNVPTKLIKGYTCCVPLYHSWNEVLINGEWIIVDASSDAIRIRAGIETQIKKDFSSYDAIRIY